MQSCSMVSYTYEQVAGQLKIWNKEIPVDELLNSSKYSEIDKKKIEIIINAKQFFLRHFELKSRAIYETFSPLDGAAVTYLLIATPFDSLRPKEFYFPLIGSFPYLGFFDLQAAKKKSLEFSNTHFVFIRPVYAYSTLGFFDDPILSSFLHFDVMELEELIFHEMFHTLFFINNDVDLNENLADFFATKILKYYYLVELERPQEWENFEKLVKVQSERREILVDLAKKYEDLLIQKKPTNKEEAWKWWEKFLDEAQDLELKKINNPAFLSSFLTYQKHQSTLENLSWPSGLTPVDQYKKIETLYYLFIRDKKNQLPFADYLTRNLR